MFRSEAPDTPPAVSRFLLVSTRDTATEHLKNWEEYRFPSPACRPFRTRSTEPWLCFTLFAYAAAEEACQGVAELDPRCAMAHWGVAMTYFHQLLDPPIEPATTSTAQKELQRAQQIGAGSERVRQFIHALSLLIRTLPPFRIVRVVELRARDGQSRCREQERSIAPTHNTREFLITLSMHTTMQSSHKKASRRPGLTPRLHPQRRTHCICHRIYSRDSAYGKTLSTPTLRRGK
jgi:hypothetical protein